MQSLFSKLASLMVMFHMAIGCQWHHGLSDTSECCGQNGIAACDHDHSQRLPAQKHDAPQHVCHHENRHPTTEHDRGDLPADQLVLDGDLHDAPHGHFCCGDDRCSVTKVTHFELAALNFVDEYLGGAESAAIAGAIRFPVSTCDTAPDFFRNAMKLRAHLLIGVLII